MGFFRAVRSGFLFCALFLLLLAAAQAQTPGIGPIRGQVRDQATAPVAGAQVTVTNEETGFSRSARRDAQGRHALPELPLTAAYRIRVAHDGFAPQERAGIQPHGGQRAATDVVLNPAAVEAAITVYGTAEGVQADSPQLDNRFDSQKIKETPILGRKVTSLPSASGRRPTASASSRTTW